MGEGRGGEGDADVFFSCRSKRFIRVRGRVVGWWLVLRIIVLGIGTRLFAGREGESGLGRGGMERNGMGGV